MKELAALDVEERQQQEAEQKQQQQQQQQPELSGLGEELAAGQVESYEGGEEGEELEDERYMDEGEGGFEDEEYKDDRG